MSDVTEAEVQAVIAEAETNWTLNGDPPLVNDKDPGELIVVRLIRALRARVGAYEQGRGDEWEDVCDHLEDIVKSSHEEHGKTVRLLLNILRSRAHRRTGSFTYVREIRPMHRDWAAGYDEACSDIAALLRREDVNGGGKIHDLEHVIGIIKRRDFIVRSR